MIRLRRVGLTAMLVLVCAVARADVLHLKDGSRVGGEVLSEGTKLVRVRMTDGKVRAFRTSEVERIEKGVDLADDVDQAERDAAFMPGLDLDERKAVRAAAERVEGPMGVKLNAAARPHAWVYGDHPQHELTQVAESVQRTVNDFADVFGCDIADALPGRRGQAGTFHVFQFQEEPAYLKYMDKVFARQRDASVDDARFALMRRQRGFWVMTPRPMMARYRGPGTMSTVIANAAHQASHALLLMYVPAGDWMPWWYLEGVATWQEIRLTGANLTYCIEVARPGDYAKPDGTPDADEAGKAKMAEKWRREVRARVRSRDDKDFSELAQLSLNEIVLEDVQQSWSVVEWLAAKERLVRFTLAYKETRSIEGACRETLDTDPVLAHQAWRNWVLAGE